MEATLLTETQDSPLEPFFDDGLITRVLRVLKGGKEATVYLCRANPSTGRELLAAKVYRPREHRNFHNNDAYKAGRVIKDARARRAMQRKTRFGRSADEGWWVHREHEVLSLLTEAGADVPRPVAASERAILMDYVGDEESAAPQLRDVTLDKAEARALFDRLTWNVELALANNVVHADLSPYNVLYWDGRATIIDLPQAVDPRTNPNAQDLLTRDVTHLCRYFARFGVDRDPAGLARDLWTGFLFADLQTWMP
jgi:RIO kinase 1